MIIRRHADTWYAKEIAVRSFAKMVLRVTSWPVYLAQAIAHMIAMPDQLADINDVRGSIALVPNLTLLQKHATLKQNGQLLCCSFLVAFISFDVTSLHFVNVIRF